MSQTVFCTLMDHLINFHGKPVRLLVATIHISHLMEAGNDWHKATIQGRDSSPTTLTLRHSHLPRESTGALLILDVV